MARTDQERYNESIAYLKTVDIALANEIDGKLRTQPRVGGEISLSKAGYWNTGSDGQHAAVRALLLCHIAYFRPPHAGVDYASTIALNGIKADCKRKSEQQVKDDILCFTSSPASSHESLAKASETAHDLSGVVDNFRRTRKDTNVSPTPVCYHGVVTWLFLAGFISKRWLAKEGNTLTAYTANKYLGDGTDVPSDQWDSIPRGYLWNIQRKGDPFTCHWGVSLGNNKAAACNNTDESPGLKLVYENGNTFYGVFPFSDICRVLNVNSKYGYDPNKPGDMNLVVKKIDPTAITTYY